MRVIEKHKIEEAKYPVDWSDYEELADYLLDAIDRFGGPAEAYYSSDGDFPRESGSFIITYKRKRFALDLYAIR